MMVPEPYDGTERRQFLRMDYTEPLAYKICKKETVSKLLQGYISNISQAGLFCRLRERLNVEDIIWLSFDKATLVICAELEKRSLVYQNGIIGKVVRIDPREDDAYDVGIQFITREERNSTNIYPKIKFLIERQKNAQV